jgi:trehalose 6-phosphate phosphatase
MTAASPILKGERALASCLLTVAEDPTSTALFCDIDGTISPIAPTPWDAVVPKEFREVLVRLVDRLGLVAFVTGRDLDSGRRMVDVPKAAYVGTHGLDVLDTAGRRRVDAAAEDWMPVVRDMVDLARRTHLEPLGVLIEDKGAGFAVHYRQAEDRDAAEAAAVREIVEPARRRGLWVVNAYLAFEVRPPVAVTKGTATAHLLAGGDFRTALFLGDDLTDCNGFDAVHTWAAGPALQGEADRARSSADNESSAPGKTGAAESSEATVRPRLGLAVAALTDETWDEVKAAADVWVAATPGMFEVLIRLLRAAGG